MQIIVTELRLMLKSKTFLDGAGISEFIIKIRDNCFRHLWF